MTAPPAALYHRVSTRDQDPTLAREELRQAARARGFDILLDLEETGSGARNDRPALRQILDAARRGRVGAVLVWKLDRWGRSAIDVLANVEALRTYGCRFVCVSQGIDVGPYGDAAGNLTLQVLAAVAEFERELIRERTFLGLARVKTHGTRSGKPIGRPVKIDENLRKRILQARALGVSWSQLAADLGVSRSTVREAVHG